MPYAAVEGVDLYYETYGEGPVLVLLHGGGSNRVVWWRQVPALSQRFRVVIYDQRGFGQSANRDESSAGSSPILSSDLEALLDQLKIDQVEAVIGHSLGT